MKHLLSFMALMVALLSVSCQKNDDASSPVEGEWHTDLIMNGDVVADVYISFGRDEFVMYQKTGTQQRYFTYSGKYSMDGDMLSGRYSDGNPWESSYKVTFNGDSMYMEAQNGSWELIVYTRTAIPDSVRDTALPHTKSAEESSALLIL